MRLNDPVRVYEGEWFSEGRITAIEGGRVTVDFLDWIQVYEVHELRIEYILFNEVLCASPNAGIILEDFR